MSARSFRRDLERRREREERRTQRLTRKTTLVAGGAIGATVLFAPAAQAATFTVDTLADTVDAENCDPGSDCTLREATYDANDNNGYDTIAFAAGVTGQITLDSGSYNSLYLLEQVHVQGPGASVLSVSGDDAIRIFYIAPDTQGAEYDPVKISGLTLTEGFDAGDGGALYSEYASLTLENLALTDNEAGTGGGAVYADEGKLTITGSTISGNTSPGEGAIYVDNSQNDGAIENDVVIQNSTFTDNHATDGGLGGALYLDVQGGVLIENSTFTNNSSEEDGGAVMIDTVYDGDLTVRNSHFSGNTSSVGRGGGLAVDTAGNEFNALIEGNTFTGNSAYYGGAISIDEINGDTVIRNTTISGNQAPYHGGGIFFGYLYDGRTTAIRNSTITGNSAGANPGGFGGPYGGGGIYLYDDSEDVSAPIVENGPVEISSSIIANNTAVDFGPDLGQGGFADGFSVGFSLIESTADAKINGTGPNLTGVDPQLGPLQNNGGPTQTHAPAFTSPVIDMGTANGLATDQRGASRTFDAGNFANAAGGDGTDIGSVELLPGGRLSAANCKARTENLLFAPGVPIVGTGENDVIVGTPAADQINSGRGKDLVCAAGGNDRFNAGAGNDRGFGQSGKDKLLGKAGRDKLSGQGGRDTLKGGGDKDNLKGGGGKDRLVGGPGKDRLRGGAGKDSEKQ